MAPRKKTTKAKGKPKRSTGKLPDLESRDSGKVRGGGAEWDVARSYKVWDANRKVFLYPDNWLKP